MQSIVEMTDSVEWQKIFRSGKVEGERSILMRQATQRFGTPPDAILNRFRSIDNADELDRLALKLLNSSSWEDLLSQ